MFYQTRSKFKMKTPEQSSIHLSKFEKDNGKIKTFFFQLNNIEPKVTPDEFALVSLCCTFRLSTLNMVYQVKSMLPLTKYRCYSVFTVNLEHNFASHSGTYLWRFFIHNKCHKTGSYETNRHRDEYDHNQCVGISWSSVCLHKDSKHWWKQDTDLNAIEAIVSLI